MNISSITSKGVKHEVIDATARAKAEDNAQKIAEGKVVHLQEKEVTENGVVTPDSEYDGLSKVTVNVPQDGWLVYTVPMFALNAPFCIKTLELKVGETYEAQSVEWNDQASFTKFSITVDSIDGDNVTVTSDGTGVAFWSSVQTVVLTKVA